MSAPASSTIAKRVLANTGVYKTVFGDLRVEADGVVRSAEDDLYRRAAEELGDHSSRAAVADVVRYIRALAPLDEEPGR